MWKRELWKNKLFGIIFILLGALTVPIEWDATFFLFSLILGLGVFFSKESCIYEENEEEYEDELSEDYADQYR